jgi:hypothetical protein
MRKEHYLIIGFAVCVFVALLVDAVLAISKSIRDEKEKETFCTCSGLQARAQYVDRQKIRDLYRSGELTEFTDLKRDGW